jgi:hypothetical protein
MKVLDVDCDTANDVIYISTNGDNVTAIHLIE